MPLNLRDLSFKSMDELRNFLINLPNKLDFWFDDKDVCGYQIIKYDNVYYLREIGIYDIYKTSNVDEYIDYLKKNFYDDINKYEWYFN